MGAYEPRDVLWYNVIIRGRERLVRETLVWAVTILLSFFWIFPISAFSTLTSVDTLQRVFPKLVDAAEDSPILQNIIQGLIPTLAVNIFMAILPLIFDGILSRYSNHSTIALLNSQLCSTGSYSGHSSSKCHCRSHV